MGIKKTQLGVALGQTSVPVDLVEQSTPGPVTNKVRLYAKDVAGVSELFVLDDADNEVQVTTGGTVNVDGGGCPPIDPTVTDGSITATANCSYVFNCACAANCILYLPSSPTVGDQVGCVNRVDGEFTVGSCGTSHAVWSPGNNTPCSGTQLMTVAYAAVVWRFNGTEWVYVQS